MDALLDNLPLLRDGFRTTLRLTLVSGAFALVLGTLLGAFRVSPVPTLRGFGTVYVELARNTPLTLVFFFFVFALRSSGIMLPFDAVRLRRAVVVHGGLRLRGGPLRHQQRRSRAGRGRPRDRADVHPDAGPGRAAAGPAHRRPAADQRLHRAHQEHVGRGRLLRHRADGRRHPADHRQPGRRRRDPARDRRLLPPHHHPGRASWPAGSSARWRSPDERRALRHPRSAGPPTDAVWSVVAGAVLLALLVLAGLRLASNGIFDADRWDIFTEDTEALRASGAARDGRHAARGSSRGSPGLHARATARRRTDVREPMGPHPRGGVDRVVPRPARHPADVLLLARPRLSIFRAGRARPGALQHRGHRRDPPRRHHLAARRAARVGAGDRSDAGSDVAVDPACRRPCAGCCRHWSASSWCCSRTRRSATSSGTSSCSASTASCATSSAAATSSRCSS